MSTIRKARTWWRWMWRRSNGLPLTSVVVLQSRANRGHVGGRRWRRRGHVTMVYVGNKAGGYQSGRPMPESFPEADPTTQSKSPGCPK
eukprot:scaffold191926_cov58-Attheya_sp.AAC.1